MRYDAILCLYFYREYTIYRIKTRKCTNIFFCVNYYQQILAIYRLRRTQINKQWHKEQRQQNAHISRRAVCVVYDEQRKQKHILQMGLSKSPFNE